MADTPLIRMNRFKPSAPITSTSTHDRYKNHRPSPPSTIPRPPKPATARLHLRSRQGSYKRLPMPQKPKAVVLPCGCRHSHVLVQRLDTLPEEPHAYDEFDFDLGFEKTQCSKNREFNYHLPHSSTSTTDFYTSSTTPNFTNSSNGNVEGSAALSGTSHGSLELPFIHENDFRYYPEPTNLQDCSTNDECLLGAEMERSGKRRTKLTKKKEWETFWLKKKAARLRRALRKLALGKRLSTIRA